ncbi:MAG: ArsR/SmtB family transcription factor [bacterium]
MDESVHRLAELFDVLGNGNRLEILFALENEEQNVNELAENLDKTQSSVSNHLKVLRYEDLVESETRGRKRFYRVKRPELLELCEEFKQHQQREEDV